MYTTITATRCGVAFVCFDHNIKLSEKACHSQGKPFLLVMEKEK
jgi:hypothetical protein